MNVSTSSSRLTANGFWRLSMSTDEQEALSRKYSNDLILLLPLKSGNLAVLNTARELCGMVVNSLKGMPNVETEVWTCSSFISATKSLSRFNLWRPPTTQHDLISALANTLNDAGVTVDALK